MEKTELKNKSLSSEVEIEIVSDYRKLKKGDKHDVSRDTADVLVKKKVAKIL